MIVLDSMRDIIETIFAPLNETFQTFTDFGRAVKGIIVIVCAYSGWRAIK